MIKNRVKTNAVVADDVTTRFKDDSVSEAASTNSVR